MRALALSLIVSVTGCKFAVQHPAVTAGIVGGTVALGTCEMADGTQKECFAIGGAAAAGLGLITGLALLLGGNGDTVLNNESMVEPLPVDDGTTTKVDPLPPLPAATKVEPLPPPAPPTPPGPPDPTSAPPPAPAPDPDAPPVPPPCCKPPAPSPGPATPAPAPPNPNPTTPAPPPPATP